MVPGRGGAAIPQRYLLSIDGGGIRGIIPLCALVELERVTGRLTRETFSFAAGTSTGAIIAAGIAAGIPAARMLELYMAHAPRLFVSSPLNLPRRVVLGWMYPTRRVYDIIAADLGEARRWRLNDAPIDLLITAKRVTDGWPWYFVRANPRNSGRTGHLGLASCATASSAAPTYFRPWVIREDPAERPPGGDPIGQLVDGGVGVTGNPVYQACVEAFFYSEGYTPEETTVVSLGTGRYVGKARPTWIWSWLGWILGELLRSPGEQQTEIVLRHFPQAPFYRIDVVLEEDIPLDGADRIDDLRRYGERLAAQIDWRPILEGRDSPFRVDASRTLWSQYARSVGRV
ncbi:MAG TPA: patatin-like phospholipase family protein [Chloroflexota bacterium]|nr:patatin-like phospholipase family protein [Chloroflexota bacterium]